MSSLQHAIGRPDLEAGLRVRIDGCLTEVLISKDDSKLLRFIQEGALGESANGTTAQDAAKAASERPNLGIWLGCSTVSLSDDEIQRRWADGTLVVVDLSLSGESAAATAVEAVIASMSDPSAKRALLRKVTIDVLQNLIARRSSTGTRDLIPASMRRIFDLVGGTHLDQGTGSGTARR